MLKETHPLGLHKKTDKITCTIFDNDKIFFLISNVVKTMTRLITSECKLCRNKQQESKIWSLLSRYMVVRTSKKIRAKGKSNKSITCI